MSMYFGGTKVVRLSETKLSPQKTLFMLAGICLVFSQLRKALPSACTKHGGIQQEEAFKRKRALGDGCYNVYLDVGANIGVHTRFLFEPDLYPLAKAAKGVFDKEFGEVRDNRDFCSFGFEPNPSHVAHHRKMEAAYKAQGWRYKFIPAGVSDHEGNLTFYKTDTLAESKHNDWGFSIIKKSNNTTPFLVPVLDLAEWIHENIANRELPKIVHGNYTKPKVVMKFDIEGAEYVMLPRLLFSGIFCSVIDFAFGEFHPNDAIQMERSQTTPEEGRGGLRPRSKEEAQLWTKWLLKEAFNTQTLQGCPGRWKSLDDEAYSRDTTPLPNISVS